MIFFLSFCTVIALTKKKKKRGHQEYKEVQEYSFIGGVDFSRDNQYVFPASSGFKRIDRIKFHFYKCLCLQPFLFFLLFKPQTWWVRTYRDKNLGSGIRCTSLNPTLGLGVNVSAC